MRHTFALSCVAASLMLAGTARAAERDIGKGSAALLFTFGGLENMSATDYQGGLGAKYFVMPNLAIRGTLAIAKAGDKDPANPGPGQTGLDGERSGSRYGLGVGAEYHLIMGRMSPYVGAGFSFATSSTSSKAPSVGTPPAAQTETQNRALCETVGGSSFCGGSEFGIGAFAGVEFFPFEKVSLGAEYQLGYVKTSRKDQKVVNNTTTLTTKVGSGSQLGVASTGLLTLTLYFM